PGTVLSAQSHRFIFHRQRCRSSSPGCNLKCRMCPLTTGETASSLRPGAMREAVWEEVCEAAAEIGRVSVSGYGEALTSVDCLPRLRELDALGVQIGLTTNGTPLTPAICTQLAKL